MLSSIMAMAQIKEYLVSKDIEFYDNVESVAWIIRGMDKCPSRAVEGSIFFWKSCMEMRVYYSASGTAFCKYSDHRGELMTLLNVINAEAFPNIHNDENEAFYPGVPKIYMTEESDITFTLIMPYEFYAVCPELVMDYITVTLPKLLEKLSPAIFLLLNGKIPLEQAVGMVKKACN